MDFLQNPGCSVKICKTPSVLGGFLQGMLPRGLTGGGVAIKDLALFVPMCGLSKNMRKPTGNPGQTVVFNQFFF
jgi:hypothetical protein